MSTTIRVFAKLLATCCVFSCSNSSKDGRSIDLPSSRTQSTDLRSSDENAPPSQDKSKITELLTLSAALAVSKPLMEDTTTNLDTGSAALTMWAIERLRWSELQALPETTVAKAKKDSDAERGKRLCMSGTIVEIATEKVDTKKIYNGRLFDVAMSVITFHAVGSSGELVEHSTARFCGVFTGVNAYPNSGGGTTHAVRAVGMFDLPENRKRLEIGAIVEQSGKPSTGARAASLTNQNPQPSNALKSCCAALKNSAATMDPPKNVYAENAAAYCNASVGSINTPGQRDAFFASIRGALRGADMPTQCK